LIIGISFENLSPDYYLWNRSDLSLIKIQQGSLLHEVLLVKISHVRKIIQYEEDCTYPLKLAWTISTKYHEESHQLED